jgi:hypothetical protein
MTRTNVREFLAHETAGTFFVEGPIVDSNILEGGNVRISKEGNTAAAGVPFRKGVPDFFGACVTSTPRGTR